MNRAIAHFLRFGFGICLAACICIGATPVFASEPDNESINMDDALQQFEEDEELVGDELESALQDFDDTDAQTDIETKPLKTKPLETMPLEESPFDWRGDLTLSMAYDFNQNAPDEGKTDLRGLSKTRLESDLIVDVDLSENWKARAGIRAMYDMIFNINGREDYTDDYLDTSESELEIKELYIGGSLLDDLDIKFGRQIVSWGTSETIRIVDVVNPLDQREPGQTDVEEMRLPVTMTRFDYYFDRQWSLTGLLIHEWRGNKDPGFGSPYYPSNIKLPNNKLSSFSAKNQEVALALTGRFSGWDMTLNAARVFNDSGYLVVTPNGNLERSYERFNMIGATVQIASGNMLYKGEVGYFDSLRFFNSSKDYQRLDTLLGIEYSGISNTDITFEILNRHLLDFENALTHTPDNTRRNVQRAIFRVSHDWANESWNVTLLSMFQGPADNNGSLQRLELTHDWSDNIQFTAGVILYNGNDGTYFEHIGNCDRIFFSAKYSF